MTLPHKRAASVLALMAILLVLDAGRLPQEQFTARAAIDLIHVYQAHLRPLTEGHTRCRLQPTCSRYAVVTLETEGIWGSFAIGERLIACERAPLPQRQELATAGKSGAPLAMLQNRRAEDTVACAGCLATTGFILLVWVGVFALWIALLVWVAKDAKNRGLDNAVLWLLLVLVTHLIGLLIYLLTRPKGNLVQCENCRNKKLEYARTCPHCGTPDARVGGVPEVGPR